jgi:hypothetical protein
MLCERFKKDFKEIPKMMQNEPFWVEIKLDGKGRALVRRETWKLDVLRPLRRKNAGPQKWKRLQVLLAVGTGRLSFFASHFSDVGGPFSAKGKITRTFTVQPPKVERSPRSSTISFTTTLKGKLR